MIIAVTSPHSNGGNGKTVTSMFLALGLGALNKKVLLTHTDAISESFYTYLGLEQYEDKTTTPTQLVKLLREGAIQPEEISDYCKNINDGVFVFTNNKTNFTEDDMYAFSDFILQLSDYDFVIYDVNDTESKTSEMVLKKADVIVLNMTQSIMEIQEFNKQVKQLEKQYRGKIVIVVCNKFSKIIGNYKDVIKSTDSKSLSSETKIATNVISYNPWVAKACNTGVVLDLYKQIKMKKSGLIELDKDITRLATTVAKAKIAIMKSKSRRNKAGGAKVDK